MNNANEMVIEAVSNTATIGETAEKGQAEHPSEGMRLYRGLTLDELPDAAFAAVTLG